jgi:hypothetical protein
VRLPPLGGEAHQFGVVYVLEGSRLGAKVLVRRLLASPDLQKTRAMRYLRHGEGLPLWRTFVERLESSAAVRRSPADAIAGAHAACLIGNDAMPGKRVQFDDETWLALDALARDRMMDFQELADEAFRDLLKKHNRPTDLKSALRQSAGLGLDVHDSVNKRKRVKAKHST